MEIGSLLLKKSDSSLDWSLFLIVQNRPLIYSYPSI